MASWLRTKRFPALFSAFLILSGWIGGVGMGAEATPPPPAVLRVTILDADTRQPTSCTVALTGAQGKLITERESFKGGFRCAGQFEKSLPPGRARLRITRGPETRAIEKELVFAPGATNALELRLERNVHLRRRGWFAGDSHAHMIHGEKTIPVDFDFVALTARAEDLQYFSLAHAWINPNPGANGAEPAPEVLDRELGARSTSGTVLAWNLEAPKNYYLGDAGRCLGHCWSVGTRGRTPAGEDVIQLLLAASAGDYESSKPSHANFESHRLIHAQGGAVSYTHPLRWWTGEWGGQGGYPKMEKMRVSNMAVELPLDTLLGPTYDGLDVITTGGEVEANEKAFQLWALLLNHGYRVAATGSSDACFDRPGGAVPGSARTYTYLEHGFSLDAVARATAQGKTFVTTGPLVLAGIDGKPPGTSLPADGREHRLELEAWASGAAAGGLSRAEICRNGALFKTIDLRDLTRDQPPIGAPVPQPAHFQTNLLLAERETAWYCVRVFGADARRQRAVTGAFFFDAPNYYSPAPVPARVRVKILDAVTGQPIDGTVSEVAYHGPVPRPIAKHFLPQGEDTITVPGSVRLRAEAPGYQPATLSPFLDNPALVETITRLEDKDLLDWRTFERIRALLAEVQLTFRLKKT